ncbi:MAG: hypothetical protein HYV77_02970, partial [Candidatus Wildermuthbacteria bacterium]|nr:hypothetical protein [Candidatus Wildermuthbacteria bacterium]
MQGELPYAVTIMYLNVCGGKWFDELTAWLVEFKKQGRLPDVLCFQEVLDNPLGIAWSNEQPEIGTQRADLWNQFRILFPGYRGFIAPFSMLSVSFPMDIGNATFVRRGISTPRHWDEMVFRERDSVEGLDVSTLPRNVLGVELNVGGKPLH